MKEAIAQRCENRWACSGSGEEHRERYMAGKADDTKLECHGLVDNGEPLMVQGQKSDMMEINLWENEAGIVDRMETGWRTEG